MDTSKTTDVMKRINKSYMKYYAIENDADLRRNNLTLNEYRILTDVLDIICNRKSDGVWTFSSGVAEWCKQNGLIVNNPHGDDAISCVNYWISAIRDVMEV